MPHGRVKRYQRNAGYGFIETEEGDLFVHHTALIDREFLLTGQQVEFQVEPGDRGPRAIKVRVTGEVPADRKNQPDWRGHRGSAPRFEGQERVLPGRTGGRHARPGARPQKARPAPASEHLGPPQDDGMEEAEGVMAQGESPTNSGERSDDQE
jgi:cold shock CspA family protein